MKLKYEITGTEETIAGLGVKAALIWANIRTAVKGSAYALQIHVQQDKLHGQVLNQRSGLLASSIHPEEDTDTGSSYFWKVGTNVKYARIHEYGGTIPAHIVEARNARVLAFTPKGGGEMIFRRRVSIPAITMPERSFLRSGLADMQAQIAARIEAAAQAGARGEKI